MTVHDAGLARKRAVLARFEQRVVGDDHRGVVVCRLNYGAVAHDVHEFQERRPVLAVTEDVALAAQGQIVLG